MKARIALTIILSVLLLPVVVPGCNQTGNNTGEFDMDANATIPLIDAYLPDNIETATFALG